MGNISNNNHSIRKYFNPCPSIQRFTRRLHEILLPIHMAVFMHVSLQPGWMKW